MKKTLTLRLTENKFTRARNEESLGELLERAEEILNANATGKHRICDARWIAEWAIQAVSEEVIRTGHIYAPLEVSFSSLWDKRAKGFRFQASLN